MIKYQQYRPKTLADFKGKESIKKNLSIFIKSANKNKATLDHCLIYGPAGVGKTTLANIIANELGTKIKTVQGSEIQSKIDLISVISLLNENDCLFIDEIHSINYSCIELLYTIMEDFKMNINVGREGSSKIVTIDVPKFTIIGATTLLGNIADPLEDRFGIIINIQTYSEDEIIEIIWDIATNFNLNITKDECYEIAIHSKGIPRIAKRILSRVIDFRNIYPSYSISEIFNELKIFNQGINEIDIRYLQALKNKKNLSIKSLSQILSIDEKTILSKIEPYLIAQNFIIKNNFGRSLTIQGQKYLDNFEFSINNN